MCQGARFWSMADVMKTPLLAILAASLLACATPAAASSIAFIKDGNVWLASPDGSHSYQVTSGGGWRSPSQADDGTLLAQRGIEFVRMDRAGKVLSTTEGLGGDQPLPAAWTDGYDRIFGPYDPKISPDGRQVAYWFQTETTSGSNDGGGSGASGAIDDWVTAEPVDRFVAGPATSVRGDRTPSWINATRTLVTAPWAFGGLTVSTWVAGGDSSNEQWWFTDPNAILEDAELSPDQSTVVAVGATGGAGSRFDTLRYYVADGPAWTHEPPYVNQYGSSDFPAPPTPVCQDVRDSEAHSPTWAPDSRALAYADKDGVWVTSVPPALTADNCAALSSRLVLPGASEPDWGPADSVPPAPSSTPPPPPSTGPAGGPAAVLLALRAPRVVTHGRSLRVRVQLARPARVAVTLRHGARVRHLALAGRAGWNALVARGALARGRWRVTGSAAGTTLTTTFRVA